MTVTIDVDDRRKYINQLMACEQAVRVAKRKERKGQERAWTALNIGSVRLYLEAKY